MIAIAEEHLENGTVDNYIALINLDDSSVTKIIIGANFYTFPAIKDPTSKYTKMACISLLFNIVDIL